MKKITIKFDNHNAPIIKCKNCVRGDLCVAGSKLLANAKKFPTTKRKSVIQRFKKAFRYAFLKTSVDRQPKRYCKEW